VADYIVESSLVELDFELTRQHLEETYEFREKLTGFTYDIEWDDDYVLHNRDVLSISINNDQCLVDVNSGLFYYMMGFNDEEQPNFAEVLESMKVDL